MITAAHRYHDFCYGHRVYGHENKCALAHGHNGRVTFHCEADLLDEVGRVVDFSVIKSTLCDWVEENWDHRFLLWEGDPWCSVLPRSFGSVTVPFNPTAENMAAYLLTEIGPKLLANTPVRLVKVELLETRKCGVTVKLEET